MKTAMQELLDYIKNAHTFTFLPEQLAKTIEDKYIEIEKEQIKKAMIEGFKNAYQNYDSDLLIELYTDDIIYKKINI